jgi:hypothetical protein
MISLRLIRLHAPGVVDGSFNVILVWSTFWALGAALAAFLLTIKSNVPRLNTILLSLGMMFLTQLSLSLILLT